MAENAFFSGRVPIPPGINQSYKIIRIKLKNGKSYQRLGDTPAAAAFKKEAALQLASSMTQVNWPVVENIKTAKAMHIHIPLVMHITFYFKTLWLRDVDGGGKHVQDAVCKHLGLNDNLIVRLLVEKQVDRSNPRVEVQLSVE